VGSWRNSRLITSCPVCGEGRIQLAREPGKRLKTEERVYYCNKCREAFSHEDLVIHWPKGNMRVRLTPTGPKTPQTPNYEPLGEVSDLV